MLDRLDDRSNNQVMSLDNLGFGEFGMPIQGRLDNPGDIDLISYQLDAGKSYGIAASGINLDLVLTIEDQTGRVVATGDGAPGSDDPIISFTPEVSGQYNLLIAAKPSEATGDVFTLYVQDRSAIEPFTRPNTAVKDDITGIEDRETKFSLFNALRDDSKLNKTELQEILLSAGDQGVVTEQEFRDLGVLAHNLSNHLEGPGADYLKYIFDSVVLGSTANAKWTGGQLVSVDLGNLQAGSSAEHLNHLVGKWFLGLDLPSPISPGDAARNIPDTIASYALASGPLFDQDISFRDVNQGGLGSCWFLAAAASLAAWKPDEIRSLFVDNQDGTYGVRFYAISPDTGDSAGMSQHWVTVNRDLMVDPKDQAMLQSVGSTPQRLFSDELWPALLEKAAAQASEIGIFAATRYGKTANSFASIAGGFDEGSAMLEQTALRSVGSMEASLFGDSVPPNRYSLVSNAADFAVFTDEYLRTVASGRGQGTLGSAINLDQNFLPNDSPNNLRTFVKGHQFAIVGYDISLDSYILYNPWGAGGPSDRFISPFAIAAQDVYAQWLLPSRAITDDFSSVTFAA